MDTLLYKSSKCIVDGSGGENEYTYGGLVLKMDIKEGSTTISTFKEDNNGSLESYFGGPKSEFDVNTNLINILIFLVE